MPKTPFEIRRLTSGDVPLMHALNKMFGDAFEEPDTYTGAPPTDAYFEKLLGDPKFIALAAMKNGSVVGGLAAYELVKFERMRSEVFIYDLAVDEEHRREGIATALIEETRRIAAACGAYVVVVMADAGDVAPITLYSKLGKREEAVGFDIPVLKAETD